MSDECPHMLTAETCAECQAVDEPDPEPSGPVVAARWAGTCAAPVCLAWRRRIDRGDDIVRVVDADGEPVGWAHAGDVL